MPLDPEALARWRAMMLESAHVHESAALIVRLVDLCGRIEVPDLAPAVATGRQVVHAWPRRLSRRQAAAYCGLSPPAFDKRVARGTLPPGSRSGVTQPPAWWLEDLDAALTAWKADCLQAQTEREIRDG